VGGWVGGEGVCVGGGVGDRRWGWRAVMERVDATSGRTCKKIEAKEKSKKESHTCSRTKVHE